MLTLTIDNPYTLDVACTVPLAEPEEVASAVLCQSERSHIADAASTCSGSIATSTSSVRRSEMASARCRPSSKTSIVSTPIAAPYRLIMDHTILMPSSPIPAAPSRRRYQ